VFLYFIAGQFLPADRPVTEKPRRISCAGSLKQIVLALEAYSADYAGEYPDQGLWQLAEGNFLSAGKVYLCPTMAQHSRESPSLSDLKAGRLDYVYLGAPSPIDRDDAVPVVRDVASNHHPDHFTWWYRFRVRGEGVRPWITVGFSDATARGFEAESWEELVQEQGWAE
jgi:hypothetical protein